MATNRDAPEPIVMEVVRELTEADLDRLNTRLSLTVAPIKQARAIHHRQARLLAEGYTPTEVAAVVGSTPQRIGQLQADPTFQELLAYYTTQRAEIDFDTHQRVQGTLVDVLELAVNEMQDRLEDDDRRAKVPLGELRKIAEFAADRTVAPPRATQQGSAMPPTRIELNFGFTPKAPKTINYVEAADVPSDQ